MRKKNVSNAFFMVTSETRKLWRTPKFLFSTTHVHSAPLRSPQHAPNRQLPRTHTDHLQKRKKKKNKEKGEREAKRPTKLQRRETQRKPTLNPLFLTEDEFRRSILDLHPWKRRIYIRPLGTFLDLRIQTFTNQTNAIKGKKEKRRYKTKRKRKETDVKNDVTKERGKRRWKMQEIG